MPPPLRRLLFFGAAVGLTTLGLQACSSTPKNPDTEKFREARESLLKKLQDKRVALVEIQGETTARRIVEVALVNQVKKRGNFYLISKQAVEEARGRYQQDPRKWKEIAKGAGADYALRIRVHDFDATTREGYSKEKVYDSQMAEERGEDEAEVERVYKVKSLDGLVRFEIQFFELSTGSSETGFAKSSERIVRDARKRAIHFPPKLRFLEDLSFRAFDSFFNWDD